MLIPKVSQVPIQQPIYVNGVMHQTWINFFERLAALSSSADMIQLIELAQKVGEQLNSQSLLWQQGVDIASVQNNLELAYRQDASSIDKFESVPIPIFVQQHCFDSVPIFSPQTQEIPPIQAVFLCPEQLFSQVGLPTNEVIAP